MIEWHETDGKRPRIYETEDVAGDDAKYGEAYKETYTVENDGDTREWPHHPLSGLKENDES